VQTGLTCSAENQFVRAELARRRSLGEVALRDRYRRASAEGDSSLGHDAEQLAALVTTIGFGLAVKAGDNATRADLDVELDLALAALFK
jgi:hypothetical protein